MNEQPSPKDICAYYGRVSTRKQKLEHQRESVNRYLERRGISIPTHLRIEDKEKRHKSHKREGFQKLLRLCDQGKVEWIVVATFDRWGVADIEEFFDLRKRLNENHVRLWSVNDHLELTGCEDTDYFRIISQAVACTTQMGIYADRNIMKMISMAEGGWHASGSIPYGTDLNCCPLTDKDEILFRVHTVRRHRDTNPLYKVIYPDGKEEAMPRMPLRDGKVTGYRLTPSVETKRIDAVRLIFELFDSGMSKPDIRRFLHARGFSHYGTPFQDNAILTILQNPAYIGQPAWGKYAIGNYKQVFQKNSEKPARRKRDEPLQYVKDQEHFIFPKEPVFDPETFISLDLWSRVQKTFAKKRKNKVNRPRERNRANHPLNGKLVCPDCGALMVTGQGTKRNGDTAHYFICGEYAKSQHIECRANSVRWELLNGASEEVLTKIKDDLHLISKVKVNGTVTNLCSDHAATFRLMGKLLIGMLRSLGRDSFECPVDICNAPVEEIVANKQAIGEAFGRVYTDYRKSVEQQSLTRGRRLEEIETEITQIGELLESNPPSPVLTKRWYGRVEELETERVQLAEQDGDLLDQLGTAIEQSKVISNMIREAEGLELARIWDVLLQSVTPIMRLETMKNGKTRTHVEAFRFLPKKTTIEALSDALEIPCSRKDKDSSPLQA